MCCHQGVSSGGPLGQFFPHHQPCVAIMCHSLASFFSSSSDFPSSGFSLVSPTCRILDVGSPPNPRRSFLLEQNGPEYLPLQRRGYRFGVCARGSSTIRRLQTFKRIHPCLSHPALRPFGPPALQPSGPPALRPSGPSALWLAPGPRAASSQAHVKHLRLRGAWAGGQAP